ncbi:rhomboid family intramembrane serine protease [Acidobacteriota bacterium]
MILPIPIGTEAALKRMPWVTIALIIVNVAIFIVTWQFDQSSALKAEAKIERLSDYAFEKAALKDPEIKELRSKYPSSTAFLMNKDLWEGMVTDTEQKERLLKYYEEYGAVQKMHPFFRYGFVPASISFQRLFAHMFLHADFFHLFFNMLFLWIVGGLLEDTWGRFLFTMIYFLGGIAAAFAHAASVPNSVEPGIGASGAVAGLMGAYTLRHARTRIRIAFVYMLSLAPKIKFLSMPAAVLLVAWFLRELFWAINTININMGVAFWAHIGGFAFGFLVAVVLKFSMKEDHLDISP